jgi:hypothetical protein
MLDVALDNYAKQTGIDLIHYPSADRLQNCDSSDEVLRILSERESAFKGHRDQYRNMIDCLSPVVQVVHALSADLVSSGVRSPYLIVSLCLPTGAIQTNKNDICRF